MKRILLIGGIVIIVIGVVFAVLRIFSANSIGALDDVTIRLKWLHQAQFAGHYVADKKGYYTDAGLNVTLNPFDFVNFPIDDVVNGKAHFGVTGADELLLARASGKRVKAIAVIYQDNPVTTYSLSSSGINSPSDFIGKIVGVQEGVNVEYQVRAMLDSVGIDYENDITIVPVGFDASELIAGEVDVASGYITNEPIQVESKGYDVNIIHPSEYGINIYADVIFTSEELIQQNPKLVKRFIKATLKGWEYALDNKDEAVSFTLLYDDPNNDSLEFDHQTKLLEHSDPLIRTARNRRIGSMNLDRWQETKDLLLTHGLLNQDLNILEAFTVEFIQ